MSGRDSLFRGGWLVGCEGADDGKRFKARKFLFSLGQATAKK